MKREEQSRFFKILLADFSQRLSIPSKFLANLKAKLPETVELRNAAGRQWRVRVRNYGSTIFLEEGWREFAMTESLQLGDFLVFKFDGKRCFRVLTFSPNGCEKWDTPANNDSRTTQKKRSRPAALSAEKTEKSKKRSCSREMTTERKKREKSELLVVSPNSAPGVKEERKKALRFAAMSPERTKKSKKSRSREMKTERKKRERSELLVVSSNRATVMKEKRERALRFAHMSPERTRNSKRRSCSREMKTERKKRERSELLVVSPTRASVMKEERERVLRFAHMSPERTRNWKKRSCSREMKTETKKRERSELLVVSPNRATVMKEERERALRFAHMSPERTRNWKKRSCSREIKTETKKSERSELLVVSPTRATVMKEERERALRFAHVSPERTKNLKKRSCSREMKTETKKRERSELLVVSPNRAPVMREERERALRIAATLELSCPAFLSVVKPSHLSSKCSMRVPRQFADEFLGGERRNIMVRCPDNEWEMSYSVFGGRCYCFTAGWKRFATENHLQVGDALVFELVNRRSSVLRFNVRIFRLHEKLPLLSRSLDTT